MHRLFGIDDNKRTARCALCGPVSISIKDGHWKCNVARKNNKGNVTAQHRHYYKKYPDRKIISTKGKGFAHLRGKQCEICGTTENLCGDHNHETKKFRGTLCRTCNVGLGMFKDNKALLTKAIEYLGK